MYIVHTLIFVSVLLDVPIYSANILCILQISSSLVFVSVLLDDPIYSANISMYIANLIISCICECALG